MSAHFSTVGIAPVDAITRFVGFTELNGGFDVLIVLIGLFPHLGDRGAPKTSTEAATIMRVSMKGIKGFDFRLPSSSASSGTASVRR